MTVTARNDLYQRKFTRKKSLKLNETYGINSISLHPHSLESTGYSFVNYTFCLHSHYTLAFRHISAKTGYDRSDLHPVCGSPCGCPAHPEHNFSCLCSEPQGHAVLVVCSLRLPFIIWWRDICRTTEHLARFNIYLRCELSHWHWLFSVLEVNKNGEVILE